MEGSNGRAPRSREYLYTGEVARLLHVSPKTVARWAKESKLPYFETLGGHRRFPADAIYQLLEEVAQPPRS